MILSLAGLQWDTPSPSHYRLVLPDRSDTIDVSFLGDKWCLFLHRDGHVSSKCFDNRDQAIGMVAQAFRNEGVL